MKVARDHLAFADEEITGENAKILRSNVDVGGVTRAGIELAHQDRVAALRFEGKQFDVGAWDWKRFPPSFRHAVFESQTGQGWILVRLRSGCQRLDSRENLALELDGGFGCRRGNGHQVGRA